MRLGRRGVQGLAFGARVLARRLRVGGLKRQSLRHRVWVLRLQARRPLEIGEQEGDGSRGQGGAHVWEVFKGLILCAYLRTSSAVIASP